MLPLILGITAAGYSGIKLAQWYEKTKEDNSYWTNNPKDIICEMIVDALFEISNKTDAFEERVENFFDKVDEILNNPYFNDPKVQQIIENIYEILFDKKDNQEKIDSNADSNYDAKNQEDIYQTIKNLLTRSNNV